MSTRNTVLHFWLHKTLVALIKTMISEIEIKLKYTTSYSHSCGDIAAFSCTYHYVAVLLPKRAERKELYVPFSVTNTHIKHARLTGYSFNSD